MDSLDAAVIAAVVASVCVLVTSEFYFSNHSLTVFRLSLVSFYFIIFRIKFLLSIWVRPNVCGVYAYALYFIMYVIYVF